MKRRIRRRYIPPIPSSEENREIPIQLPNTPQRNRDRVEKERDNQSAHLPIYPGFWEGKQGKRFKTKHPKSEVLISS